MTFSDQTIENFVQSMHKIFEKKQLDETLREVIFQAFEFFKAQAGYIAFLDQDGSLEYQVGCDREGNLAEPPSLQTEQMIHRQVLQPRAVWSQQDQGIRLAAPLEAHGSLIGAILLEGCEEKDRPEERMRHFAVLASAAIEYARAYKNLEAISDEHRQAHERLRQEMERLAVIDALTGISNHRHFYELGEQIFSRSKHPPFELSALMLDLDHFSRINEQYGHVTGDAVLQIVVNRLLQGLRPSDLIGRYGGEKFAVLLPRTAWDDACKVAERCRGGIETNMIEVGFNYIPLTISVGVAGMTAETKSLAELLSHADEALVIAKQRNGNRWVVWSP